MNALMSAWGHKRTLSEFARCPLFPQKRTSAERIGMSAKGQKRTSMAYSITSSARASTEAGTVMPSALAVLRLMLRWKSVGCSNGRSAGLAPFKMRSTK